MGKRPLIIEYTNLLNKHRSPKAKVVLRFLNKHKDNTEFQKRAKKLNILFLKAYEKLTEFEAEENLEKDGYSWLSNLMYRQERWLDRHNHKMELVRTLASLSAAIGTVVVLLRLYGFI